jgi:DNA-binding protein H-NS
VKPENLETLNDDELRAIISRCNELVAQHDRERKAQAMESARATLAAAGLSLKDLARAKAKPNRGPSYKGGRSYQHPANKALVWNARGQKPTWLRELELAGGNAVELPSNDNVVRTAANDNAVPAVKRMA